MRPAEQVVPLSDRHGALFAATRDQSLFERALFESFCALLPVGGHIGDPGCRSGAPLTVALLTRGFAVTGLDASKSRWRFIGPTPPPPVPYRQTYET